MNERFSPTHTDVLHETTAHATGSPIVQELLTQQQRQRVVQETGSNAVRTVVDFSALNPNVFGVDEYAFAD